MKNKLAIIILAAGKGTRMNSKMPKVLHKVGNQSMIMHVINTAYQLGAEKILAVLGYQYKMIQESFFLPLFPYVSTSLYYISLSLGFGNIAQGGDPL